MKPRRIEILAMVLVFLPATIATAANKYWKNSVGSGNWSGGNNWSNVSAAGADNGGVPAGGDVAHIILTDGAARTITYDVTAPTMFITYVDLTGPGTNRTTFSMSGNTLTTQALGVGFGGRATFNHSGGIVNVIGPANDMAVGEHPGSNGIYNLSGTGVLSVFKDLFVGRFGTGNGTFNQTGGTTTVGNALAIGTDAASIGVYNLSSGTLSVGNNLSINSGSTLNVNGGTLRFNTIGGTGGLSRVNYTAGTIRLAGSRSLTSDTTITGLYGAETTIPAGKHLFVEGNASMTEGFTQVTVNGGSLTSSSFSYNVAFAFDALSITNGGTMTTTGTATLADSVNTEGVVVLSGAGSTWTIGDDLIAGDIDGGFGTAIVGDQSLLYVTDTLSLGTNGEVRVEGGTLRFAIVIGGLGKIDFERGTIQLAGNQFISSEGGLASAFFDENLALRTGKGVTIEGTATLLSTVTIDGGTLSAGQMANPSLLDLKRGTLNLTNQSVTVGSGGLFGSTLDVNEDMTVNVTLGITNQGVVTGDGQIGGTFANAAAGELRAQAGRSLRLTGANNTNAGQIKLFGGELEFTQNLTNGVGGFISGNGSLIVGGGLVNQGTMSFAGTANIEGTVTNAGSGKIISGGGGATIFYDDVVNNGEIRTSTNGFTVFFGGFSGSGMFTGTGTVNFEGNLSPGSSPAQVNFGGDVVFGEGAALAIELGGTTAGSQHDKLNVTGDLALDGGLIVTLINGFTPAVGQTFNILDWLGTRMGTFDSLSLPALAGLSWDTSQLYSSGVLSVTAPGVDGDYNNDGVVDAADYVMWRKLNGTSTVMPNDPNPLPIDSDQFATWRVNYGENGSGGGSGGMNASGSNVAEPASGALMLLALGIFAQHRRLGR